MLRLLLCLALPLLLLEGCSTRETGKSVAMASQGVEAGERILGGDDVTAALNDPRMPVDLRAVIVDRVGEACDLFAQARENLAPAVNLLGEGKPVDTGFTVEQIAEEPQRFIKAAGQQVVRAETEVRGVLWWKAVVGALVNYGSAVAQSGLAQLGLALGGASGVGAIALAIGRVISIKNKVQMAMAAYADDAAACNPAEPKELEAVREQHRARQQAMGIHPYVKKALAQARKALPQPPTVPA